MTIHSFRLVLAQRSSKYSDKSRTPRLSLASALLHKLTGHPSIKCTQIVNEGRTFQCEFRKIVQATETMLDYGYRIYHVPRNAE
ncbi:hypothetical protein UFOVP1323_63 [uncultured Caudovirales phage]|uniref:Uncharacterized protein n=1 Tax=uncultured Caudovirales phage TaxID=2100421 RepID=A0A6J5S008_9CAUD|nr:hypothetical protein UFOVP1323_63 [uncultured Caudovirales phage]